MNQMIIKESQDISRLTTNPLTQPNITNQPGKEKLTLQNSLRPSGPLS